jgi:hypothetical protein
MATQFLAAHVVLIKNISYNHCYQTWRVFAAVRHMSKTKMDSKSVASSAVMVHKTTMRNSDRLQEKMKDRVRNATQILDDYSPIILTRTLFGLIPSNSP